MIRGSTTSSRITAALCTAAITAAALAQEDIGEVQITHNYSKDLNAEALATPEADRAWPRYRDALMALSKLPDDLRFAEANLNWPARKGEPGWEQAVAHIQANLPALKHIRQASAKPHMGYIVTDVPDQILARHKAELYEFEFVPEVASENPPLYRILLPQIGEARNMARHLNQDLLMAVEATDPDRVMADLAAMHRIAGHARQPPVMINELVGLAIDHRWRREIILLLSDHPALLRDEQLVMLRELVAMTDHIEGMHAAFQTEDTMFLDAIQRAYTINDKGEGYLTPQGHYMTHEGLWSSSGKPNAGDIAGAMASRLLGASRSNELAQHEQLMGVFHAQLDHPRPWSIESRLSGAEAMARVSELGFKAKHPLGSIFSPALDKALTSAWQARFQQSITNLALAIEQYHRKHAQYPKSLNDLVPDFLDAIPTDLFDGEPIRYKLTDAKPLIYSIGADRDDDGGISTEPPETSPHAWMNPMKFENSQASDYDGSLPPDGDWILYPPQ